MFAVTCQCVENSTWEQRVLIFRQWGHGTKEKIFEGLVRFHSSRKSTYSKKRDEKKL